MNKLETLKQQLELSETQVKNPFFSNNPVLKASIERKIADLKKQIAEMSGDETKIKSEKPKTETKPVKPVEPKTPVTKETTPKVIQTKKPEIKKPEKVEKTKSSATIVNAKIKVGDNVKAIKKGIVGEVIRLKQSADYADKILVYIQDKKGNTFQAYAHLVEKI
jgi:hypothetical protein